jgi:hypothetical protein
LVNHFFFCHTISTTYYLQGNGHVKFTNKVIGTMLTELVNKKRNDWDEHLGTMLFTYCTTYKVSTRHTPFQLVYGLYPLMLIEYLVFTFTQKGITINNPIWVWLAKYLSWKNWKKVNWRQVKAQGSSSGNKHCGFKATTIPNPSSWEIMCCGFLKGVKNTRVNSSIFGLDLTMCNTTFQIT